MLGFTAESGAEQRGLERRFDEQLNADNLDAWMRRITAKPFYTGAPHNKDPAGAPNPLDRHTDTLSKGALMVSAGIPSLTAALKTRAPSRCRASPWSSASRRARAM